MNRGKYRRRNGRVNEALINLPSFAKMFFGDGRERKKREHQNTGVAYGISSHLFAFSPPPPKPIVTAILCGGDGGGRPAQPALAASH